MHKNSNAHFSFWIYITTSNPPPPRNERTTNASPYTSIARRVNYCTLRIL
ncbi:protein of unknown function (plasmid) [Vibrio harveyi]|nr:protein of unknown function [Vibrio harveyi]